MGSDALDPIRLGGLVAATALELVLSPWRCSPSSRLLIGFTFASLAMVLTARRNLGG